MEFRQLKSFLLAAKHLNFTEAAREMHVNQSTFSQNIKALEDELGLALFYRNSHEVMLTEAGKELFPFAEQVIQQADEVKERMNDLRQLRRGTLVIGTTHSFSPLLQETLTSFLSAYPAVQLCVHHKTRSELMLMLLERKVDFVLSFSSGEENAMIETHNLFEDRLSLIVSREHPAAKEKQIAVEHLSRYSLALPAAGTQARSLLDSIAEHYRLTLTPKIEIDEVTPLLQLVRHNGYATILSSAAAEGDDTLTAIPLNTSLGLMHGTLSVLKGSYRKASMTAFVELLMQTNIMRKRFMGWAR